MMHLPTSRTVGRHLMMGASLFALTADAAAMAGPADELRISPDSGIVAWLESSMVKVRLDDTVAGDSPGAVRWQAARDEFEHVQLCLRSPNAIEGLRVEFEALTGDGGTIAAEHLTWRQVGYVKCEAIPRRWQHWYPAKPGWWPDPLLPVRQFNLHADTTQPIWLTVYVPPGTAPGQYAGLVKVMAGDRTLVTVPLELEVWPIDLPRPGQLRTAFSFAHGAVASDQHSGVGQDSGIKSNFMTRIYDPFTSQLHRRYLEFLSRHRIPANYLYLSRAQPLSHYQVLAEHGTARFNLMNVAFKSTQVDEAYIEQLLDQLSPVMEQLHEAGLADQAYVYGFDEFPADAAPKIRQIFGAIKERWPELRTMAVLNWEPPADLPLDVWVVMFDRLDPEAEARWRAAGKELWMYHAIDPSEPYLNSFIEYPAVYPRLLMWHGAQARVDGWLYYCVNYWEQGERKPIDADGRSPYVDFNPQTWKHANGDGSLLYPGVDGPIGSIRLENLTDGIEDFELLHQLRAATSYDQDNPVDVVHEITSRVVRGGVAQTTNPLVIDRTRASAARQLIQRSKREQAAE